MRKRDKRNKDNEAKRRTVWEGKNEEIKRETIMNRKEWNKEWEDKNMN